MAKVEARIEVCERYNSQGEGNCGTKSANEKVVKSIWCVVVSVKSWLSKRTVRGFRPYNFANTGSEPVSASEEQSEP